MIRLSLPYFYDLGTNLSQLSGVQIGTPLVNAWGSLWSTKTALEGLFSSTWFAPALRSAALPAQALLNAINTLTSQTDFSAQLNAFQVNALQTARAEFETVIRNELAVADVYFVTRKAAYDVSTLIGNAEAFCSPDLGTKVPQAIPEIREAGKCLAFELSTAAGFHILRTTELVLRAYWDTHAGGKPQPTERNIGSYLRQMEANHIGSEKVIAALKQIKNLHRNPLFHPEESLNLDEAVTLIGICVSVMNAMLKEIPPPPPVTLGDLVSAPNPI